jgi:hypothetical protein
LREMQRLRTNGTLLMFIFGAILSFITAPAVVSYKIDERVNNLEKAFHIRDITAEADENFVKSLITYQQINHSKAISDESDEDWRLYEIHLGDIRDRAGNAVLQATPSEKSCEESSTLPAWKIDKSVGKFLVKINHAKQFAGKTFFLCYRDEATGHSNHFGNESRFSIG